MRNKFDCLSRLQAAGFNYKDACALRRISMTLRRWHELECGDSNDYASWCITRGYRRVTVAKADGMPAKWQTEFTHDDNGKPFIERHAHSANCATYEAIPDRERGALKRLQAIMARYPEFASYVQTDPRGCALYILRPGDVPEFDGWAVWCRDDTTRNGEPGPYVRATSRTFSSKESALEYARTIASGRAPELRQVPADVSAYYSRGIGVYK